MYILQYIIYRDKNNGKKWQWKKNTSSQGIQQKDKETQCFFRENG